MPTALTRRILAATACGFAIVGLAGGTLAQTPPQTPPPQTPPPSPIVPPLTPRPPTMQTPENVPFPADSKIAFINLQVVFSTSQFGKAGAKALQDLQERKTAELAAKEKAIQTLQNEVQSQASVLSSAVIQTKRNELDRLQREAQFAQQNAQAESDSLRQQILAGFEERVVPVIEAFAREKGLYAVLDVQNSGAAYVYRGLDVSAEIVKRLDAKTAGGKS